MSDMKVPIEVSALSFQLSINRMRRRTNVDFRLVYGAQASAHPQ
jgi:hypothetical protein